MQNGMCGPLVCAVELWTAILYWSPRQKLTVHRFVTSRGPPVVNTQKMRNGFAWNEKSSPRHRAVCKLWGHSIKHLKNQPSKEEFPPYGIVKILEVKNPSIYIGGTSDLRAVCPRRSSLAFDKWGYSQQLQISQVCPHRARADGIFNGPLTSRPETSDA